jgi:hypothetical protein
MLAWLDGLVCCFWERALQQNQAKSGPLSRALRCSSHQTTSTTPCPHQQHPLPLAHYFLLRCLLHLIQHLPSLAYDSLPPLQATLSLSLLRSPQQVKQRTYPSSRSLARSFLTTPRPLRPACRLSFRPPLSLTFLPPKHHISSQPSCVESSDTSTTWLRRTGSSSSTLSSMVRGLLLANAGSCDYSQLT